MPGLKIPTPRDSDGSFTGFLTAIIIVGAVVAVVVLFWTAIG